MDKIKFRFETVNGDYVYIEVSEPAKINDVPVKAGSRRQFVGCDSKGNELYEGDEITCGDVPFLARLNVGIGAYCFNDDGAFTLLSDKIKCSLDYAKSQGVIKYE